MSATEILEQIRRLPENEQREITGQILEEFGDFDDGLSPEQIDEAERRAELLSCNLESGIPWAQIRAEPSELLISTIKSRKSLTAQAIR
jgi:hypothetical protein